MRTLDYVLKRKVEANGECEAGPPVTWVRSDDNKPLNRKVRPLSDGAYRLDDHALHYCARHETDGLIYAMDFDEITLGLKGKQQPQYIAELVTVKLWHEPGDHCSSEECPAQRSTIPAGAWAKHDYFTHNKTHAELESMRSADRKRKRNPRGIPDGIPLESREDSTMDSKHPVPSRPVPSQIVSNETIVALVPPDPRAERLVEQLSEALNERGVKFKTKGWLIAADRLLRLDKRDFDEAGELLVWGTKHHFWASIILSIPKFREKYDQLRLQRERELTQPVRSDPMHDRQRQLLAKAHS